MVEVVLPTHIIFLLSLSLVDQRGILNPFVVNGYGDWFEWMQRNNCEYGYINDTLRDGGTHLYNASGLAIANKMYYENKLENIIDMTTGNCKDNEEILSYFNEILTFIFPNLCPIRHCGKSGFIKLSHQSTHNLDKFLHPIINHVLVYCLVLS